MTEMFKDCEELKVIKLPPKLLGISLLNTTFENCKKLISIDLSGFNGNEDKLKANGTFKNCIFLKNVTFSDIESNQLKIAFEMLFNCTNLTFINMSKFLN